MTNINTTTSNTAVYQDPKLAPKAATGQRRITARFRSPARSATILIPSQAWDQMEASVPASYAPLLSAVLETAAKSILAKRLEALTIWPLEVSQALFTADAIMAEASGANTEWMTREELTAAWEASATRKAFTSSPNYQANKAYRQAVEMFKDLILKLAGKTSQYQESELDKMLAKLHADDMETELGTFIIKRVEQLRNRPQKASVDLDIL